MDFYYINVKLLESLCSEKQSALLDLWGVYVSGFLANPAQWSLKLVFGTFGNVDRCL